MKRLQQAAKDRVLSKPLGGHWASDPLTDEAATKSNDGVTLIATMMVTPSSTLNFRKLFDKF
jgi:hypothetical protein